MHRSLKFNKQASYLALFLLATIPLLFGAVHPIVQGSYTAVILIFLGGWLLINSSRLSDRIALSPRLTIFLALLFCLAGTSIALPMGFVDLLSPVRAERMAMVNQLAMADHQWLPLSYNSMAGLQAIIFLFALVLYYLALKGLLASDRHLLTTLIFLIVVVGIVEAIYGMLQVVNPHLGVLWLPTKSISQGVANGTIIYKNQYASLLNMCWPLGFAAALITFKKIKKRSRHKSRKKRLQSISERMTGDVMKGVLYLFVSALIMLAVLFSESRGGSIAMGITLVLLLIFFPISKKNRLLLTLFLAGFFLFYGSFVGYQSIIDRFFLIQGSGQVRFNLWLASLPMLSDHFITGIGLESYRLLSPVYLKNFPENVLFDRAHNEYLELTIELGLPLALLFFTTLFSGMLKLGHQLWKKRRDTLAEVRSKTIVGMAAFGGLVGFLFHGIADFGWRLPANLLYGVTLVALVGYGLDKEKPSMARYSSRLPRQ